MMPEPKRILLLHADEGRVGRAVSALRKGGHEVRVAVSAEEAGAGRADGWTPQLVLLNAGAAGTDGARAWRDLPGWAEAWVVWMVAPDETDEGLPPAGVDDVAPEPATEKAWRWWARAWARQQELSGRARASEQRFRRMFAGAATGIAVATVRGEFIEANPAYCRMLGYTEAELRGFTFLELTHPEDRRRNVALIEQLLAGEIESFVIEKRYLTRGGEAVWSRGSVSLVRGADGVPRHLVTVTEDITDQKWAEAEAARLEQRLGATLANISDAFYTLDGEWRFTFVNRAAEEILQRSRQALVGREVWAAFPDMVGSRVEQEYRRAVAERVAVTFDFYFAPLELWLEVRAYPAPPGLAVYFRDVTAARVAAEALHESEARFRLVARAAHDAIWDWDVVRGTVWWNDGFERLFGYPPEEARGGVAQWRERLHPEDRERVARSLHDGLALGEDTWSDEYRFRRRDGSFAYVMSRGYMMRGADGQAVRMVGGMTDLSERRESAEKMARQAALIDQTRDAIVVRGLDHAVRFWSRGAQTTYGWTSDEAVGRDFREVTRVEASAFDAMVRASVEQGAWTGELKARHKDGRELVLDARCTVLKDAEGALEGFLSVETDVTERKWIEGQFRHAQRLESIGTLAGGMAHDLNNLLAPIVLGAGLLKLAALEPDEEEVVAAIEASARRAAELVRQVLAFARGGEGRRERLRMETVIRELETIAQNTLPKNISFDAQVEPGVEAIHADPTQINQVLLNLCVNARDAMPDGGRLLVQVRRAVVDEQYATVDRRARAGRYVLIEVSDNGVGIPADALERIFEPFFTTKEVGKGTGLGLPTVLGIVRDHGGFINVFSEPGHGATFAVYLPAVAPTAVEAGPATPSPVAASAKSPVRRPSRGRGETVLLVDDEPAVLALAKQTLETFGYQVLAAEDGARATALYAARGHEIAVVVTDLLMPVMDGRALAVALYRLDPKVRIVVASGQGVDWDEAALPAVRRVLPKPYTMAALLDAVREHLGAPAVGPETHASGGSRVARERT